jgi:predicted NBD/HSP70 family sugar kinase
MSGNLYAVVQRLKNDVKTVLNLIQKRGPVSKDEIRRRTGIKLSKINRLLAELEKYRLIVRTVSGLSSGGRKPFLFDINTRDFFILSFALGSIRYGVSVVNLKMHVIGTLSFDLPYNYTPRIFLQRAFSQGTALMRKFDIKTHQIIGLALSSFGNVDKKTGKTIRQSSFYMNEHWLTIPLRDMAHEITGLPTTIDSGINCQTLVHYLYGDGRDAHKLIVVSCGMGIRTGIIIDGHLISSNMLRDDPFGHMSVKMDGKICKCGNSGCIECYSSLSAIQKNFISKIKEGRTSIIPDPIKNLTLDAIDQAYRQGDELSREILDEAGTAMGCGLANYINLFNPDLVILQGIVVQKSETFCRIAIQTAMHHLSNLSDAIHTKIITENPDTQVFALGAAATFWEEWLFNP